jgi:hypothetical protein
MNPGSTATPTGLVRASFVIATTRPESEFSIGYGRVETADLDLTPPTAPIPPSPRGESRSAPGPGRDLVDDAHRVAPGAANQ